MSTKHTPGPWTALIEKPRRGMPQGWCAVAAGGDMAIDCNKSGANFAESAANARLIAAASALYAALLDYVRTIAASGGGDRDLFMAAIREADNAARAALALVDGEAK